MANTKSIVLKLANYCQCHGCDETLEKVRKIDGVRSISIDAKGAELTIFGTVDPQNVIRFLEKKGKKAKLVREEIPQKRNNYNVQITFLPRPVVQEFNDQSLVLAQVQELAGNVKGLKQLEVTFSKTVKVTFNENNKEEVSTQRQTQINIVKDDDEVRTERRTHKTIFKDDDHYRDPKSQSHCCCGHDTAGTTFGSSHRESATQWQENYSPQRVIGYEPSAPPILSRYGYSYAFGS